MKNSGPAEAAGKKIDEIADVVSSKINERSGHVSEVVEDSIITAKVKSIVFATAVLKSLQIGVTTVNGVVTLRGSVDSQQISDSVKTLAEAVAGANKVDNLLIIQSN
jgi:hyperosmotically inducible protein